MTRSVKRVLFWTPRIVCILFAAFVSLFSLDVFDAGYGFWETIGAFLIHNIPVGIILIVLAIAWRREWVGGIVFIGLGLGALYLVSFRGGMPWSVYLTISGPLFLVGVLFLVNWRYRAELRARS